MAITFNDMPALCEEMLHTIQRLDESVQSLLRAKESQPEQMNNDTDILTIDEAAHFLGLAKSTLYSKVCRREIPHIKKGNRLYFSKQELNDWLKAGQRPMIHDITRSAIQHIAAHMRNS